MVGVAAEGAAVPCVAIRLDVRFTANEAAAQGWGASPRQGCHGAPNGRGAQVILHSQTGLLAGTIQALELPIASG